MTEEEVLAREETAPEWEEDPPFSELDIRIGMLVEVLTMKNTLTFVGRVKNFSPSAVLTIKEAADAELPPVLYNQEVKLRFFQEGKSLVLRGQVCGSNQWIWRVDRLESQFGAEHRMFFRQNVDLKAQVAQRTGPMGEGAPGPDSAPQAPEKFPCQLLDVSVGGLLVRSRKAFQEGDCLQITDAVITAELGPFSFQCQVQRVQKVGGNYLYGCKFLELSTKDEDRLLQAIFIVQRKDIHKQRDRGL